MAVVRSAALGHEIVGAALMMHVLAQCLVNLFTVFTVFTLIYPARAAASFSLATVVLRRICSLSVPWRM